MLIGGSGSGKAKTLLDLIREQNNDKLIDKIYLYAKDLKAHSQVWDNFWQQKAL